MNTPTCDENATTHVKEVATRQECEDRTTATSVASFQQESDGVATGMPASVRPGESERKYQRAASTALFGALVLLALWIMRDFIPAVAWAAVIAIALWPVQQRLATLQRSRTNASVVAAALAGTVGFLVVLPLLFIAAQVRHEARDLSSWFRQVEASGIPQPELIRRIPFGNEQIAAWWQANLGGPLHESPVMGGLHSTAALTFGQHFGSAAAHGLILFGFTLVTLFVIFRAGPRLGENLTSATLRVFGATGARLAVRMAAAVRGTVTGLVVVGLGEGVLLGIAYAIASVPHAALLGLMTAIAAMLPFCAPIVFGGAALWLFAQGASVAAIGVAVSGFIVVFAAEHFVRPLLIGSSSRLPFLLVLFGILGGAQTFGLLGLFIGPALMTVLTVLWEDALPNAALD
jgi:predicted PurR-regulated permease PerM